MDPSLDSAAAAYASFESLLADKETAVAASHTLYAAFDPAATEALPSSLYNVPPEATATGYSPPTEEDLQPIAISAGYEVPRAGAVAAAPPAAAPSAAPVVPGAAAAAAAPRPPPPVFIVHDKDTAKRPRDWNTELQRLIDAPESAAKYHALSALIREFNFVAETFGKVIISEMAYPDEMRTVQPTKAGGQAGGEKYIHKGIFFKFAIDLHGIYGGDEHAMKAAEHDLKGLIWYSNCGVKQLHFPLMSLIDYLGYRLIAISILPLAKDGSSLLYGSCDGAPPAISASTQARLFIAALTLVLLGGKTVRAEDPVLNQLMETAGGRLKLKRHRTGLEEATKRWLCGPVDIEGHKGLDGRYYVLDYARTFPCEAFSRKDPHFARGQHLFRLLRPELLRTNPVPLSSDAFSAWGVGDKESVAEVQAATSRLFIEVIPRVAASLSVEPTADSLAACIQDLHHAGINVRHLGLVREQVKDPAVRALLLLEMVARATKNEIRGALRRAICEHPLSEEPARRAMIPILNSLFGVDPELSVLWWAELKRQLQLDFRGALTTEEQEGDLRPRVIAGAGGEAKANTILLERVQALAGFKLQQQTTKLFAAGKKWKLLPIDVETFQTQFRSTNLMDITEALSCLYEAQEESGAEAFRMAVTSLDLFQRALTKLRQLAGVDHLVSLAKVFHRVYRQGFEEKQQCYTKAIETLQMAIDLDPVNAAVYRLEQGNIMTQFEDHQKALDTYRSVLAETTDPSVRLLCKAAVVTAYYQLKQVPEALSEYATRH